jgi:hypothetical protein
MRKSLLVIGLLAGIVYACNQRDKTPSHLLSTSNLPTQVFSIDITKDTVLHTKNGALIRIPHGALSAAANPVQLEIKEAYTMQDILKAGLTTMSNGQPLSSGGMIYLNPVGDNKVEIKQPISIATPTPFLDSNMKVFKGEVQADSTINWVDPKPLAENPQLTALDSGRIIFTSNCATCHTLGKDLTGPDLAHIATRPGPGLYSEGCVNHFCFVNNPVIAMEQESYYRCLKNKFGGVMMTSFPNLSYRELCNIFGYIENESERRHLPVPDNGIMQCKDSCELYLQATKHWSEVKAKLESEAVDMVEDIRHFDTLGPVVALGGFDTSATWEDTKLVTSAMHKSLYYQFTIESFGWYNIDILTKGLDGVEPSELLVHIQGGDKERFAVYLIIPSIKLLAPGGPLKDQKDMYGFFNVDGSIPLPQNTQAYLVVMGERDDQIIFAKTAFITSKKQSLDLSLTTVTKEVFQQQIAGLPLSDLTIQAKDTKIANEMRTAVKELKKAEQLKPKNCDCDCFLDNTIYDSSGAYLGKPAENEY